MGSWGTGGALAGAGGSVSFGPEFLSWLGDSLCLSWDPGSSGHHLGVNQGAIMGRAEARCLKGWRRQACGIESWPAYGKGR